MSLPTHDLFRLFDPEADVAVTERRLPHWAQSGTLSFLTWRTWDSLPAEALASWLCDRSVWLTKHRIDSSAPDWREQFRRLPAEQRRDFHQSFSSRWQALLDDCRGECVLRQPQLAEIVARSLRHFDGERYHVTDFVVMPNHVHVLVAFGSEHQMLTQCESWKHFTAVKLNKMLGRSGRFWQVDGFDHLVRSEEQFRFLRAYIADNPRRAGLPDGEFIHYSVKIDEDREAANQ